MLRKRQSSTAELAAPASPNRSQISSPKSSLLDRLTEQQWVLPWHLQPRRRTLEPSTTLVGTVGPGPATTVDPAGLLVGAGWSLDWWIGADDRWHLPSVEASVRQTLIDDAPVVETRLRVPGGDVVQRVYGIRSQRMVGDEWVVVEVENLTPVPCAVAFVVRPFVADAIGAAGQIEISPTLGGVGRDEAHLIRVDSRPAVVLPRRPATMASGSLADGDVKGVVTAGEAGSELVDAKCSDGLATGAYIYPLAHTAKIRVLVPVGEMDPNETIGFPTVIPDVDSVGSGWAIHARGPRVVLPEPRAEVAFDRAVRQLGLAHDGSGVHRDGVDAPVIDAGATETILTALDMLDRPNDVGPMVVGWADLVFGADTDSDVTFLATVAWHQRLHRVPGVLEWVMADVAAAVERIDRADRKGRLTPAQRARAARALGSTAEMLALGAQPQAAQQVEEVAGRIGSGGPAFEPVETYEKFLAVGERLGAGEPGAFEELETLLATASSTGTWPGPGRDGRRIGHDLAASAAVVIAVRSLLVAERRDGLDLLPTMAAMWFGGGVEIHDAPTAWGKLSYGIRWHGQRPALLWDLQPHDDLGPVTLRTPSLDPEWSTTELRGETLLAEVAPPEGVDLYRHVPDHPDIDPEMRRPGATPAAPPPVLPEGGTFS